MYSMFINAAPKLMSLPSPIKNCGQSPLPYRRVLRPQDRPRTTRTQSAFPDVRVHTSIASWDVSQMKDPVKHAAGTLASGLCRRSNNAGPKADFCDRRKKCDGRKSSHRANSKVRLCERACRSSYTSFFVRSDKA